MLMTVTLQNCNVNVTLTTVLLFYYLNYYEFPGVINLFFPFRFNLLAYLCLPGALMFGVNTTQATEILSLHKAVTKVLIANPGLAAIDARAKALAALPDQLETLPDPRLSINMLNLPLDSFSFTQENMTQLQLGISQVLPYPGKLALRSLAARHEAGAAEAEVKEARLQLVRDVKTVWWNIFYLDRALDVIRRNKTLLAQFVNVAETRYTVGRGFQHDILLAQLELSKLNDRAIAVHNIRKNEGTRLNVLMTRPAAETIQLAVAVDEILPELHSVEALQQQAIHARPGLIAQTERFKAARSRVDLAKKDYSPDFQVGVIYGLRNGNNLNGRRADFGSVMFSMNLPIYTGSKQDRAVDQRNAERMQQKYRLHDQRNQVASQVQRAITDYHRAGEQATLYQQEIIPLARQTVEAMMAGYQSGTVDFLNLVRSQTTLYDYETQYWKAFSVAKQALARLISAVGEDNVYAEEGARDE
ncbi:Heavy metal RND efflux outer membrane protein, CzcC family [hydrothermal vent metagenome]|uniref:Heavy metal RND efflux outer membrane protein, CzcC family n=1 Tax=hydrothermal vent metagenome TaxID=652676 RepID=A0A3B0ZVG1_9ZZZZ